MTPYDLKKFIADVEDGHTVDLSIPFTHLGPLAEIAVLADIINAEFKSDPMSVRCFDLHIVKRLDEALVALAQV